MARYLLLILMGLRAYGASVPEGERAVAGAGAPRPAVTRTEVLVMETELRDRGRKGVSIISEVAGVEIYGPKRSLSACGRVEMGGSRERAHAVAESSLSKVGTRGFVSKAIRLEGEADKDYAAVQRRLNKVKRQLEGGRKIFDARGDEIGALKKEVLREKDLAALLEELVAGQRELIAERDAEIAALKARVLS